MKFLRVKPAETTVDHRYQRDLDKRRVEAMTQAYNPSLLGVPVVSRRADDSFVRIDGQHRLAANVAAGHGDTAVMMEVHDGLSLSEEADLFLRLNGGRTAVCAIDKFKARIEAQEPSAIEIRSVLAKAGCKITRSPQRGGVQAVAAVEVVYHRGNLEQTMRTLHAWLEGSPVAFDGELIRAVSSFLVSFPKADPAHLAARLDNHAPERIKARLRREYQSVSRSKEEAARVVFADIYNQRTVKARRVGRLQSDMAAAAE